MKYRYIKNLRDHSAHYTSNLSKVNKQKPSFRTKADYREWCADIKTDHVFYSALEGRAPSKRISNENPVHKVYGVVADYDASVNWAAIDGDLKIKCAKDKKPTWRSKFSQRCESRCSHQASNEEEPHPHRARQSTQKHNPGI